MCITTALSKFNFCILYKQINPLRMMLLKKTYPLSLVPLGKIFSIPPSSKQRMAFLIYSCPCIDGANDLLSRSNISMLLLLTNLLHTLMSSLVKFMFMSLLICVILFAITIVLKLLLFYLTKYCLVNKYIKMRAT